MPDRSPLDSPAIGTAPNDLIQPCFERDPRPARPPPPEVLPAFSMAFSGGGFRATLAALGVVRFMADAGLLDRVRCISSVSGGSVAHGLFARDYRELQAGGFSRESVDELVISPFVNAISTRSLTSELLRNLWRAVGSLTARICSSKPSIDGSTAGCSSSGCPAGADSSSTPPASRPACGSGSNVTSWATG